MPRRAWAVRVHDEHLTTAVHSRWQNMNEVWTLQVQHRRAVRDRVAAMRKVRRTACTRTRCGCLTKLPCASACSTNATCSTAHCLSDEHCATRTRWTPSELARWLGPCKTRRLPSARGGHRCKPPWRPSWSKPPCKPSARRARIESAWPVPRVAAQCTAGRSLCLRMGGRRVIVADTEAVLKTALAVAVSSRERYVHDCPVRGLRLLAHAYSCHSCGVGCPDTQCECSEASGT